MVFLNGGGGGGGVDGGVSPLKSGSAGSVGSSTGDGGGTTSGPLQREWDSQNLHDLGAAAWEEDSEAMIQRGQRYSHPLLQSKSVRFGLLSCVVVAAVVLGVNLAASSGNDDEKLGVVEIGALNDDSAEDKDGENNQAGSPGWWEGPERDQPGHTTMGKPEGDAEKW